MSPPSDKPVSVASSTVTRADVTLRRFLIDDPIGGVTSLLHRAYRAQTDSGLRPLAGRQDDRTTLDRVLHSDCYLAIVPDASGPKGERIVGVILFNEHERVAFPAFFLRPEVAHFAMFAVEPDLQGAGIGRMLLEQCETNARALGFAELALSMAEPDAELGEFYTRRGYRFIEFWQWPYTNYRSCILSKPLG